MWVETGMGFSWFSTKRSVERPMSEKRYKKINGTPLKEVMVVKQSKNKGKMEPKANGRIHLG